MRQRKYWSTATEQEDYCPGLDEIEKKLEEEIREKRRQPFFVLLSARHENL